LEGNSDSIQENVELLAKIHEMFGENGRFLLENLELLVEIEWSVERL
jgi:hypothetical protein